MSEFSNVLSLNASPNSSVTGVTLVVRGGAGAAINSALENTISRAQPGSCKFA